MNKKVIYVIGCGRSGTTLVDISLGNIKGITSCGEINRFYRNKGIVNGLNEAHEVSRFWEKIRENLNLKEEAFGQLSNLTRKFEYYAWFMFFFISRGYSFYQKMIKSMLETIFNQIDDEIVVDSSKYPARAIHLQKLNSIELSVIYLVRDPISVVKSFSKKGIMQPEKSFISSLIYYIICNFLCSITVFYLKLKRVNCVKVKYEEFTSNPSYEIQRILDVLELGKYCSNNEFNPANLTVGRLFEGNRIRLSNTLNIKANIKVKPKCIREYLIRFLTLPFYR